MERMIPVAKVENSQEPTACFDAATLFLSNLVELKETIFINGLESIVFPPLRKETGINVFNQLCPDEKQHSLILCELLNPSGKHNCGNLFLKLFFHSIIPEIPFNDNERWIVPAEK